MFEDDPLFVGLDVGTTGARACAVDLGGRIVQETRRPYPTTIPRPGWAEQDPRHWRERSLDALTELCATLGGGDRIRAIGLTGQCPTIAPLSDAREPVGPGLLYRDNRATAQAARMCEQIGDGPMHARTGHLASAFHVGPKVLWMRENDLATFDATDCFMQPRDLVAHALTGLSVTDETHANSTVFFDLESRCWAEDLLAQFALDRSMFPDVVAPWTVVGPVSASASRRTGLHDDCPVVIGAADSQCAGYGSGLTGPGPISEMAGASSCLNSVVEAPLSDLRITHYSYVVPALYSTELGLNTTGAAVDWAVRQLGIESYASLDEGAAVVHKRLRRGQYADARVAAPLFLPYLGDGERDDVGLRAAFIGLSDRHGVDELAYAVLEGLAFGVAESLSILHGGGSPLDDLRVAGGVARLATLGSIKADTLEAPVIHLREDSAPVGVALLAASHAGFPTDARIAIEANVERATRFEPDPCSADAVRQRYAWFLSVRASTAVRIDQ